MRRGAWVAVAVGAACLGGAWLAWSRLDRIVVWAMTPSAAFDPALAPPAPDYAEPASWSALPERDDVGDAAPPGHPAAADPAADVFYVHPTSFLGPGWSGPLDDATLNDNTDRLSTRIQATAFNGVGAVWAPRYRQVNGVAFVAPSADGDRALALALEDVKAAFASFQSRRDASRPLLVVGHSQGAVLAERLLGDLAMDSAVMDGLAAAWLIGADVSEQRLNRRGMAACRTPEQTGCVVAYNTRRVGYTPSSMELVRRDPFPRLCVNPLTGRADEEGAPATANLGAVFLESDDPAPRPGFADARCQGGTLWVTAHGPIPRDRMSRILDHVLGDGNLHAVDVQLWYMNLRADAARRLAAWQALRAAGASAAGNDGAGGG